MVDPRTITGIIGNVISFGLFLSPVPTFIKIHNDKSVQAFKADPYLATMLNCLLWSFYGLPFVHPDSLLVITINGTGCVIQITYIIIFYIYSDWPRRRKISLIVLGEVIFFIFIVFITMVFLHGTTKRSMLVGILCILLNIAMYAAPLTVMKHVIKTKSVKYMPFYLSLANLCNGIVWSIYALYKMEAYVLIPNGLGTLSGVVQLTLYAMYYKTTNWDEEYTNTSETELKGANKA